MNGKAKMLDGKENLVGSRKQTKGNLFYQWKFIFYCSNRGKLAMEQKTMSCKLW